VSTSVVRNRWAAGAAARLAWVSIPDPQVIEAVASSGAFDAVVLDLQHSPFDRAAAIAAIRTAAPHPVSVLARIPSADTDLIGWLLDGGLDGVIVAMCDTPATAERIVAATRYQPQGVRSYGTYRPNSAGIDPVAYSQSIIVLPMIESASGMVNAAAIAAVEGVDGLFIGPSDLGLSMGEGVGQDRHEPAMLAAYDAVKRAAAASSKQVGIFAVSAPYAAECAANGFSLVVPWFDSKVLGASIDAARLP
jgi:4-hydroxy-2-oxoheptanedioate aldolase